MGEDKYPVGYYKLIPTNRTHGTKRKNRVQPGYTPSQVFRYNWNWREDRLKDRK